MDKLLEGKTVILGVAGSIAAYKAAYIASSLIKLGGSVHVIMTENAANFINPITFETLTSNKCLINSFDRNFKYDVQHISLAKKADAMLIAPATANIAAKIASGIADDMLSTTALSVTCPLIISPAMNERMYKNPVTQANLQRLRGLGYIIAEPARGRLACGDTGTGALPPEDLLVEYALRAVAFEKIFSGKKILVTAGGTIEAMDPVRFISNRSSGKMGYAIARAAMLKGADVTLVTGKTALPRPYFTEVTEVTSAEDMFDAVSGIADSFDIIIKAAAVSDYRPADISDEKIKKGGGSELRLERTKDILEYIGRHKKAGQFLCGFSMETENLIENSKEKLQRKNLDMIAANNLKDEGAGFEVDTNKITVITENKVIPLPVMSKFAAAVKLLDIISGLKP